MGMDNYGIDQQTAIHEISNISPQIALQPFRVGHGMTSICIDTLSKVAPESRQYREKLRIPLDNDLFPGFSWVQGHGRV